LLKDKYLRGTASVADSQPLSTDDNQYCNINFLKCLKQTNAHLSLVKAPEVKYILTPLYTYKQR